MANHLVNAADFIQDRAVGNFSKVNSDFGKQLTEALKTKKKHP
jgi:catalase